MSTGPDAPQPPNDPNQPPQAPPPPSPPPQAPPPPPAQAGYPPQQPPPGGYQPQGYAAKPPLRPDEEKLWAIGAHIGPIVVGFLAPLLIWLLLRDRSAFVDRHAKEALNFQISYMIYFAVAAVTLIILIGILLLPIVGVMWLVFMIIATVKAANMEDYRYPLIFRFVS